MTPPPPPKIRMFAALFHQEVPHVAEVFVVPTLIRANRDGVSILLNGRFNDVGHGTIVAQMNDLCTARLYQSSMILMAASCPSNKDAAVTTRILLDGW